jgi:hypothetical protein
VFEKFEKLVLQMVFGIKKHLMRAAVRPDGEQCESDEVHKSHSRIGTKTLD